MDSCDCYLYPIIQDNKIGFINSYADIVIQPQYDDIVGEFTSLESLMVVCKDSKCGVLNTDGLEMLMGEYQSISLIGTQYAMVMNSEYQKGIIEIMTKQMAVQLQLL